MRAEYAVRRAGLVLLGSLTLAAPVFAEKGPCTNVTTVTTFGASGTALSTVRSTLCGVDFIATSANGFCQVVDSPDGTINHAQARVIAEPGAAVAYNSEEVFLGDLGYPTQFGIGVASHNGRCTVHWGS